MEMISAIEAVLEVPIAIVVQCRNVFCLSTVSVCGVSCRYG